MDEYTKTYLQFAFPVYLWILIGIIILLGHYLSSVAKLLGDKAVPVLATVFLLSVAKLLRTIIVGLSYATLEHSDGHQTIENNATSKEKESSPVAMLVFVGANIGIDQGLTAIHPVEQPVSRECLETCHK